MMTTTYYRCGRELSADERGGLIDACRLAANLYDDEVEKLQRNNSRSISAIPLAKRASEFRMLADKLQFANAVIIDGEELA